MLKKKKKNQIPQEVHAMQKSNFCGNVLELQCTGPCCSLCNNVLLPYYLLFPVNVLELQRQNSIYMLSQVFLDTSIFWFTIHNEVIYFFGCWRQNIFIKDTTKILANISKHICKHNASLLNWQHFEKQYDKTTQLVSTLVQNPYIFDHITYVPT